MSEPKVSIIIPSYNRFEYFLNAIESVQSQNYENKEIGIGFNITELGLKIMDEKK